MKVRISYFPTKQACQTASKIDPLISDKSGPVFETPALVSSLDNITAMGNAIEHGRGHFGIPDKSCCYGLTDRIGPLGDHFQ